MNVTTLMGRINLGNQHLTLESDPLVGQGEFCPYDNNEKLHQMGSFRLPL